jgi:hypothetical protein
MHRIEELQWFKQNNLVGAAKSYSAVFQKVLRSCLNAKDESLLIIADKGYENSMIAPIMGLSYYLAARELNLPVKLVLQEEQKIKGDDADQNVIDSFYNLRSGNLLALSLSARLGSIREISHSFRGFVKENRHRFVSTTSLGQIPTGRLPELIKSIDTDFSSIRKKGYEIKDALDNSSLVRVKTKAGTDFQMSIKSKSAVASVGDFREEGTGGNVPIGEVFVPPKWKHAEGTIVIDGSSAWRQGTQLIKKPISLKIEKDEIVDISGGEEAKVLEGSLIWAARRAKHPWGIRRIGELGIGINPDADIIGATIVDEKTLGTAHFGIGSNYWFGGTIYAIIHYDQIIRNPEIYVDGRLLRI